MLSSLLPVCCRMRVRACIRCADNCKTPLLRGLLTSHENHVAESSTYQLYHVIISLDMSLWVQHLRATETVSSTYLSRQCCHCAGDSDSSHSDVLPPRFYSLPEYAVAQVMVAFAQPPAVVKPAYHATARFQAASSLGFERRIVRRIGFTPALSRRMIPSASDLGILQV
jgi:hypothetical protein